MQLKFSAKADPPKGIGYKVVDGNRMGRHLEIYQCRIGRFCEVNLADVPCDLLSKRQDATFQSCQNSFADGTMDGHAGAGTGSSQLMAFHSTVYFCGPRRNIAVVIID